MSDQDPPTENPFQTPPMVGGQPGFSTPGRGAVMPGSNYVRQVTIVAVLLIIHGALLLLAGGGATGFGLMFAMKPEIFANDGFAEPASEDEIGATVEEVIGEAVDDGGGSLDFGDEGDDVGSVEINLGGDGEPSETELAIASFVGWFYGGIGVALLAIGILQIYAGIRNLSFKGRTVGIVALSFGILTVFTCWCAPTAIGLAIYGLIVYLSPAVTHAFQLRKDGVSKDNILARFPA